MISDQPNMGRKQIFDELPLPSKIEDKLLAKFTYKGIFIVIKLLLDIRSNLVKISEGRVIKPRGQQIKTFSKKPKERKPDNPIKGLDNIKVDPVKMATIEKGAKLIKTKVDNSTVKLQEGSVNKGGVNDVSTVPKPEGDPKGQQSNKTLKEELYSKKDKENG